jgi:hypothetical protein
VAETVKRREGSRSMAPMCFTFILAAAPTGWGDEPAVLDGFRRVTEADLQANDLRDTRVYLDGKLGGGTPNRLGFMASTVRLVVAERGIDPVRLAALARDQNVRVFGLARRDGFGPLIEVERIDRLPDDGETYGRLRAALPADESAPLYALADRLQARFERYGGAQLAAWARETRRAAVEVERRALAGQPARLYDLARRTQPLLADEALTQRLLEFALWAERKTMPPDDPAARLALADKWNRLVPTSGEGRVLRREALQLEERRLPPRDPQARYRLAQRYADLVGDSASARDLTRAALRLEVEALAPLDDAGRYRLAAKVAELVQDAEWSRRLLAEGAGIERAHLAGRPPVAYFNLAERYARDLGDRAARDALLREGLAVQERRLDPRDLNDHFELALAYLTALGDRAAAVARLKTCIALVPDEPRVREKLTELGLVQVGDQWYDRATVATDPKLTWQQKIDQALAAGRIEVGMTSEQVRRAWGAPTRVDAAYTRDGRTVLWSYPAGATAARVTFRHGRVVAWTRE